MTVEVNLPLAGLSRTAQRVALAAGLGLVVLCAGSAVLAQDGPRNLFPEGESSPTERTAPNRERSLDSWSLPESGRDYETDRSDAPEQARPDDEGFGNENSWRSPERSTQPSGPTEGQARLRGGILVDELDARFPETLGPLTAGNGGLGLDLWQGSRRGDIIELLREQPRGQRNPVARDLLRRLLLSSAQPPREEGRGGEEPELLEARAHLLMALGEYDNLVNLLVQIPGLEKAPDLARLQVEAAVLAAEPEAACPMVRRALSLHRSQPFWPKAQIYCQIYNGEKSAAGIGIGLQREVGNTDTGFLNLADASLGVGEVPRLSQPSALDLALLRWMEAGDALVTERLEPSLMAGAVMLQGLEADQRRRLAEEAARRGVLPLRLLGEAYTASPSQGEIDNPLRQANQAEGAAARALYYQVLRRATTPEARGEALQALMDSARQAGLESQIAEIALPALEQLNPEPAVAWLAPTAVRVALLTGRFERAQAWTDMARRTGSGSEARAALTELWPLFRLAGLDGLEPGMTSTDWAEARISRGAGREGTRALLQFYERAQVAVSGRGGLENANARLRGAVREDRRGEGLLLSLQAFGQGRLTEVSPRPLTEALAALSQLGFSREARLLAMDALVARGL
ncbi:hypothetical protein [Fodinicurvata fenggangensis]|uniref:hypothetical protein n=1 Tax=Fodinicurvata fenggangensis TaxID=1121830 RepID=UPI00047B73E7|nr:hypothetical protein [Fodinicurvata fenggangensis]